MKTYKLAILIGGIIFSAIFPTWAAPKGKGIPMSPCDGSGGWGAECAYNSVFKIENMAQIGGEVASIDTFTPEPKMTEGQLIKIRDGKEIITVHLGPVWYLKNQDLKIQASDKVDVKGAKVVFNGSPVIVAAEVAKGDQVLVLRDSAGRPLWSGWRRKTVP